MDWEGIWAEMAATDSISGRWAVGEKENLAVQTAFVDEHALIPPGGSVFVPMAGASLFPVHLFKERHIGVFAVELIPEAVSQLRLRLEISDWIEDPKSNTWVGANGRVTVVQGDVLTLVASEVGKHDLIFDKDAFGALPPEVRADYVAVIKQYLKPGGHVMLEVKDKHVEADQLTGPPFHVTLQHIQDTWLQHGFVLLQHQPKWIDLAPRPMTQQLFLLQLKC